MALKKGMFESYVKEREAPVVSKTSGDSKYSHNRVFDEPESLKKALANQDIPLINRNEKNIEAALFPSSVVSEATNNPEQAFSDTGAKSDLNWRLIGIEESQLTLNENLTQTKHKLHTNQTHKLNTNLTQSEHSKGVTNVNQTQTQHKVHTKLNTRKTQTTHKLHTNQTQSTHIATLIGVQRRILLFIFEECKKARSHVTEPLSVVHIANSLEIPSGSIKTSIMRLCEKAFIVVNSFKNGRGGWSTYEIPGSIYNELLQMETRHKLNTNQTQTQYKVHTKLDTQLNTNALSSSSNIDNITTTGLPTEWNFDIAAYGRFGFTQTQLKQLASLGVISASQVEQSLIEFSYDLNHNALPSIKTTKINFLMGLLRSGHSYVSEGFKNAQEQAIMEMARRYEGRRKDLLEAKFLAWEEALDEEARKQVLAKLPPSLMVLEKVHGIGHPDVKQWFFDYYLRQQQ